MERKKLSKPIVEDKRFVSSGSVLLDLVLGGGWGQGRAVNVVGDSSTGKTGFAIEACANFAKRGGVERVKYGEAEAAFDEDYAQVLGMPPGVELGERLETIEAFAGELKSFIGSLQNNKLPALYVLDSLDAVSDEAEMKRELDKATYGQDKAKKVSEFFRREIGKIEASNITLMIISQTRDNIGATMFQSKNKRAGGRALQFYCSQVIWLAETGKIKKTIRGHERTVGITVKAKTQKNKMGMPFREAELTLTFGYGIDDEVSMMEWLKKYKAMSVTECTAMKKELNDLRYDRDRAGIRQIHDELAKEVTEIWMDIERDLEPPSRKYEDED